MAAQTYSAKVIVLRKTKLGESDLILTLLSEDGSLIKAIAKGARKPSNTFASRLELYSFSELLCSRGKTLDIIKEARLISGNERLRFDLEYSSAASSMVEFLDKTIQLGLENSKLFQMTEKALRLLSQAEIHKVPVLTAAHLLKACAFSGFRPSLTHCVNCGTEEVGNKGSESVYFSFREGGVICSYCANQYATIFVNPHLLEWAHYILISPFEQILEENIDYQTAFSVLHFCQSWIREQIGVTIKSLSFMFTTGLFSEPAPEKIEQP